MDLLRRLQVYLTAAMVIAILYAGWVFLNRRSGGRRNAATDMEQTAREAEWQRLYGGSDVKILQFYAREANLIEGDKSVICYGVLNAKSVRMEPAVPGVSTALNKCVEIEPVRDTRYTLIAEGHDGRMVSESFVLGVKPDVASLPKITSFQIVDKKPDYRGRMVFLVSFSQQNGLEVSIDPEAFPTLHGAPNGRFYAAPEKTTTYTLTVTGKFGHRVQQQLVLEVPAQM
jgi:hypothetical protein